MRQLTWAAALLALFGTTRAEAQHYSIPRPILMPSQVHDRCATCVPCSNGDGAYSYGNCANGNCSNPSFFSSTVTVDGYPYDSSNPCTRSITDELASDIALWISTREALCSSWFFSRSSPSDFVYREECTQLERGHGTQGVHRSISSPCDEAPQLVPPPVPTPDEEVDPFRNDPTASRGSRTYHIASPQMLYPTE